eukprot:766457-Hanusia_phi.AAC.5
MGEESSFTEALGTRVTLLLQRHAMHIDGRCWGHNACHVHSGGCQTEPAAVPPSPAMNLDFFLPLAPGSTGISSQTCSPPSPHTRTGASETHND